MTNNETTSMDDYEFSLSARDTIATYLFCSDTTAVPNEQNGATSQGEENRSLADSPASEQESEPGSVHLPANTYNNLYYYEERQRKVRAATALSSLLPVLPTPSFRHGRRNVPCSRSFSMSEALELSDLHPETVKRFTAMKNMVLHINGRLFTPEGTRAMIRTVDLHHIFHLAEKMMVYLDTLANAIHEERKRIEYVKSRATFTIELTDKNAYLLFMQRAALVMKQVILAGT